MVSEANDSPIDASLARVDLVRVSIAFGDN